MAAVSNSVAAIPLRFGLFICEYFVVKRLIMIQIFCRRFILELQKRLFLFMQEIHDRRSRLRRRTVKAAAAMRTLKMR